MSSFAKGTVRIDVRKDTASNWASANPILKAGEFGYETDTGILKIGDGSSGWDQLPGIAWEGGSMNIQNFRSDGDITFKVNDGGVATEVMRLDGDVSALKMASGKQIQYGAAEEYISGDGSDLTIASGGHLDLTVTGHIDMNTSAVGFTQEEPTFDATDTIITFSTKGNKQKLTLTDNCADIHFKFPALSGNFVCVLLQDGTGGRTVSNWKTADSEGNAGNNGGDTAGAVRWLGGVTPANTETANRADIASFYWDADNEIAYGTYSKGF